MVRAFLLTCFILYYIYIQYLEVTTSFTTPPNKVPSHLIFFKIKYHVNLERLTVHTHNATHYLAFYLSQHAWHLLCMLHIMMFYYPICKEFGGNQTCFVPFYACALYKYISSLTLTVIILKEFLFNKLLNTPGK